MDPETKFFQRSDGTLAYDDSGGSGELVIMEPGMGALRSEYRFLAPEVIKAGYRVVTADLRGHGESSTHWPEYTLPAAGADILALIDHLDSGPAHFIGTSFSPGAAIWAEVEEPENLVRLISICSSESPGMDAISHCPFPQAVIEGAERIGDDRLSRIALFGVLNQNADRASAV